MHGVLIAGRLRSIADTERVKGKQLVGQTAKRKIQSQQTSSKFRHWLITIWVTVGSVQSRIY